MKAGQRQWAQAGKSLMFCSGLACMALALHDYQSSGPALSMLRIWVGGFGLLVSLFSLKRSRATGEFDSAEE